MTGVDVTSVGGSHDRPSTAGPDPAGVRHGGDHLVGAEAHQAGAEYREGHARSLEAQMSDFAMPDVPTVIATVFGVLAAYGGALLFGLF